MWANQTITVLSSLEKLNQKSSSPSLCTTGFSIPSYRNHYYYTTLTWVGGKGRGIYNNCCCSCLRKLDGKESKTEQVKKTTTTTAAASLVALNVRREWKRSFRSTEKRTNADGNIIITSVAQSQSQKPKLFLRPPSHNLRQSFFSFIITPSCTQLFHFHKGTWPVRCKPALLLIKAIIAAFPLYLSLSLSLSSGTHCYSHVIETIPLHPWKQMQVSALPKQ